MTRESTEVRDPIEIRPWVNGAASVSVSEDMKSPLDLAFEVAVLYAVLRSVAGVNATAVLLRLAAYAVSIITMLCCIRNSIEEIGL